MNIRRRDGENSGAAGMRPEDSPEASLEDRNDSFFFGAALSVSQIAHAGASTGKFSIFGLLRPGSGSPCR